VRAVAGVARYTAAQKIGTARQITTELWATRANANIRIIAASEMSHGHAGRPCPILKTARWHPTALCGQTVCPEITDFRTMLRLVA